MGRLSINQDRPRDRCPRTPEWRKSTAASHPPSGLHPPINSGSSGALTVAVLSSWCLLSGLWISDPVHYTELSISTVWDFAAGDYVEVHVEKDSGTTVNIATNPPGLASALEFGMVRLP
jgi:hypothetical protein